MATVEELLVRIDATTEGLRRELRRAERGVQQFGTATERRLSRIEEGFNRLRRIGQAALGIWATAQVAQGVIAFGRSIIVAADNMQLLRSRLQVLTGSAAAFDLMADTADELGVSLEDTADTFARFALAAQDIGLTVEEVDQLTETVLQLGRVGGASAGELSAGAMQLAQALASGRLQGDELRSILENMPLVARAIADELGVSVGQLRELGSEGELTSDRIAEALLNAAADAEEAFGRLPSTLEQEEARFGNAAARMAEAVAYQFDWLVDAIRWAIRQVTDAMNWFADNFGTPDQRRDARADRLSGLFDDYMGGERMGIPSNDAAPTFGSRGMTAVEDLLAFRNDELITDATRARIDEALVTRDEAIVAAAIDNILADIGYNAGGGEQPPAGPPARSGGGGSARTERDPVEDFINSRGYENDLIYQRISALQELDPVQQRINALQAEWRNQLAEQGNLTDAARAAIPGLAEEYVNLSDQLDRAQQVQDLVNDALAEGIDETDLYNEALGILQARYDAGIISAEQFAAAQDEINSRMGESNEMADKFAGVLVDGFNDMVTGAVSFEEALTRMAARLAELIIQMTIMEPLARSISQTLSGFGSGGGGGGGIGGFIAGLFGAGGKVPTFSGPGAAKFADGGIMTPRGPLRLQKYANGGVANSPQLAMFGEGRTPEAYVPLPDGRSIPVKMQGGGTINAPVTITIDATGADREGLMRVERRLDRLTHELPSIIYSTTAEAQRNRRLR